MMRFRFITLPAFKHKTSFSCGNILLDDHSGTLNPEILRRLLLRHTSGDWGDVPRQLRQTNRYALEYNNSLLSCYFRPAHGIRMVVIHTCADRHETYITVHA